MSVRCRDLQKERLSRSQAHDRTVALNARRIDKGSRSVQAYRCDGHWHVGHKPLRNHRKRR